MAPKTLHNSDPCKNRGMVRRFSIVLAACLAAAEPAFGVVDDTSQIPNIFKPQSTPAHSIFQLSLFVLIITTLIFIIVFSLLAYSVIKFRRRATDDGSEPVPVYGSNQVELAWTVIPALIVLVMFFATARVIHDTQDAAQPLGAIEVTAIGHQFWWEFRYPGLGVVTANELHARTVSRMDSRASEIRARERHVHGKRRTASF